MGLREPTDEATLLEAAQRGESAAIEALLALFQPKIIRFSLRMCRDRDDAEDVAQDTMLAAARGLPSFRGRSSVSTWLYTIARSFCIKKRRRSKYAPAREDSLDDDANREVKRLAAPERSPEQAAIDRELQAALVVAIDGLDPMYRETLVLRDMEGLTAAEVAAVVGTSVSAVKSRLHRARATVRQALLPYLEPEPEPKPDSDARRPRPDCPDIVRLFSQNLEGEVSDDLCDDLQQHVDACRACQRKCDSIARVMQMCRAQPLPEVPSTLRDAVREAIESLQSNSPIGSFK